MPKHEENYSILKRKYGYSLQQPILCHTTIKKKNLLKTNLFWKYIFGWPIYRKSKESAAFTCLLFLFLYFFSLLFFLMYCNSPISSDMKKPCAFAYSIKRLYNILLLVLKETEMVLVPCGNRQYPRTKNED